MIRRPWTAGEVAELLRRYPHERTILTGEQYVQQTGFYDGEPYRNKYHAECWEVGIEDSKYGDEEFTPYSAPCPDRVQAIVDARRDAGLIP